MYIELFMQFSFFVSYVFFFSTSVFEVKYSPYSTSGGCYVAVSNPAFMLTVFWIYVVLYHLIFSALLVDFFVCAV